MTPVGRPGQPGRVGRSSWTGSCRRRGTWRWPGSSSGSARSGPARWSGSGPTRRDPPVDRRHPGQDRPLPPDRRPTWPGWSPRARSTPARRRCRRSSTATRSRSNGPCPGPAPSRSAAPVCWPRRSSAGRRVGIRIEPDTLMFFDLDTRELLRVRPNPLSHDEIIRLRGVRPAGPPPRPSIEPIRVQRRASNTGVIMVCGQKVALGRIHRHQTVTVARLRDHPGHRARRRRDPRRPPHHHPARA